MKTKININFDDESKYSLLFLNETGIEDTHRDNVAIL